MSLARLRSGELLAGSGSLALFALMFMDWFQAPAVRLAPGFRAVTAQSTTGWGSLGWFLVLLVVALILLGAALVVLTARAERVALPLAAGVVASFTGIVISMVLALRLITQPGLGVEAPNHLVDVKLPAYLGLLAAIAITSGAWRSIADERTEAPESAYTPPPARPAPSPESDAAPSST